MPTQYGVPPDCSDWPDCNTPLSADLTLYPDYPDYVHDSETDHFVLFTDPASPRAGTYDPAKVETVKSQLECAYRYFVCELGMNPPIASGTGGTEMKTHVYLGNNQNLGGPQGRIALSDLLVIPAGSEHKLMTTPVHEFFHVVQGRGYSQGWSTWEVISEGLAALAEQLVSFDNFENSFVDSYRQTAITRPHMPSVYGYSILYRYLAEQLAGDAPWVGASQTWAVDRYLESFILRIQALGSPGIRDWLEDVFSQNVTRESHAKSFNGFLNNYITMLYAFRHVSLADQPRLALRHRPVIQNATPQGIAFASNATQFPFPGVIAQFDNVQSWHSQLAPGFTTFLSAEYHKLNVDYQAVRGLRFVKSVYDDDIRFQLIARSAAGKVVRKILLKNDVEERFFFPGGAPDPAELVLVAYTVGTYPLNGSGAVYGVSLEALS